MKHTQYSSWSQHCWNLLKKVPSGKVTTYQELAHALGSRAYRAVGSALNRNPYAPRVPCHRVVKANGELGGFALGKREKTRLLMKEGVFVSNGKITDFEKKIFKFKKVNKV